MADNMTYGAEREVLRLAKEAIDALDRQFPADFDLVVDAILATSGNVIVCGVGKSGHIGRKIAATLTSTGVVACFLHATEAAHGDLGIVSPGDIVILISNSGESTELFPVIEFASRSSIPTVGISSNAHSTLMKAVSYQLLIPKVTEACINGVAPTTSTTITLVLGDALAVRLMEKNSFSPADFKKYHPGGALGASVFTVQDIMHGVDELPCCRPDSRMKDVVVEMTKVGFGVAVVLDDEKKVAGVITDGDVRRNIDVINHVSAREIANIRPVCISKTELISSAVKMMEDNKVYSLLVTEDGHPLGLIRMHDILKRRLI